jgi:hypothetical protein
MYVIETYGFADYYILAIHLREIACLIAVTSTKEGVCLLRLPERMWMGQLKEKLYIEVLLRQRVG